MISVKNLTKYYANQAAVDNLSFEINKGEVVGFLGPNGAGKTTTMRMIAGFLFPDYGNVEVAGVSVSDYPEEAKKRVGYLPENNPLYKNMLVSEMLGLAADLQNISKKKRKKAFDFVVSSTGIGNVFYRPIGELSKGYRQRVGLALALLNKPEIIILDEPTEGLDPNQRMEIRNLIKDLSKNHTVVLSTHVMQEASAVCSRLLVINKGKLASDGTPDDLIKGADEQKILVVEIEGEGARGALENIVSVKGLEILDGVDGRFSAKITVDHETEIEKEISELSHRHKWVIWKIYSEKKQLEDVFKVLTSKK